MLAGCSGGGAGSKPTTFSISGVLSGAGGRAVPLDLAGTSSGRTTADSSGNYTFGGLPNGSYTVTPSLAGWTCSPANRAVTVNGGNVAGQDFAAAKDTYGIAGAVSGAIGDGVLIMLGGTSTGTTTTAGGGHYAFSGLEDGSYVVTPTLAGYTFSPASLAVTVSGGNVAGQNFTATKVTYSVSGAVLGAVGDGVHIALGGTATAATTTSGGGLYSFTGLANGSYVLTPSLDGYTFAPASLNVTVGGASVTGQDFTATKVTYSISGAVSGAVANGVRIALGGASSATSTSAGGGAYSFSGLANGNYILTPSLDGYTFAPASLAVTVSGANVAGQNFTATKVTYSISGAVLGAIGDGVHIALGGAATAATTTFGGGLYSFTGLANGSYVITPSLDGYTFTPASLNLTVGGASVTGQDFTAVGSGTTHTISGKVSGVGGASVTMKLTGGSSATAATDGSGAYALTGLASGSYRVTPYDWVCDPVTREVTVSGADVTDQDFACATMCVDLPYSGYAAIPSHETVDGKAHVFGGYAYAANNYTDTIRVFDIETSAWSTLPFRMPYPIADGGTAIYFANHFYVTPALASGEFAGWGSHNKLIDIDLAKGTASETVAIPYGGAIWQLLSCAANGKMYIFGGHNGQDQVGIFEYVPGASSMSLVARMGYAHRNGAVTLGSDGAMYIMGQSSQIERFDPVARTVQTMRAALPAEIVGIYGISAIWHVAAENAIYFTPGGYYNSVLDPPIYKFDYGADTMASTGLKLSGWVAGNNVYNTGFRDGANPHVAFYFQGANSTALYRLCRIRLGVP